MSEQYSKVYHPVWQCWSVESSDSREIACYWDKKNIHRSAELRASILADILNNETAPLHKRIAELEAEVKGLLLTLQDCEDLQGTV